MPLTFKIVEIALKVVNFENVIFTAPFISLEMELVHPQDSINIDIPIRY